MYIGPKGIPVELLSGAGIYSMAKWIRSLVYGLEPQLPDAFIGPRPRPQKQARSVETSRFRV